VAAALKSWRLFWVLAFVVTAANSFGLPFADFRTESGTEWIILHSVICALPFLVLAFTASSLAALWKVQGSRWLLANRRYFGLAFAFGMGWHFAYVGYFMLSFGNHLRPVDLALDITGLVFLLAMTLTSFQRFRRRLTPANWRRLHKTGIYTLWFLPTYFYLDDLRKGHDVFNLAAFTVLLAAFALRVLAWARRSSPLEQTG
jgi:DMSO/TMAO reductase YedYZ heme-binding membrane subunit